jgi:hypothetical protein
MWIKGRAGLEVKRERDMVSGWFGKWERDRDALYYIGVLGSKWGVLVLLLQRLEDSCMGNYQNHIMAAISQGHNGLAF